MNTNINKSPNKAKTFKSINNPYKKLGLTENEKIRIETVKDYAKLFGKEFKTRKRGSTEVENIFHKNEKLKEFMDNKSITPEQNKEIHDLIEKDIEAFQKDFGYLQNVKELNKTRRTSITGFNLRKNLKDKIVLPVSKGALNFAKNHKIGVGVTALIVFSVVSHNIDTLKKVENIQSKAYNNETEVLDYQDNKPGNILDIDKSLMGNDYAKFVQNISEVELSKNLKFDSSTANFKEFDKMYGKYMSSLQKLEKGEHGIELTQEEGRTFLVMQYIATNSYIDYLDNKQDKLVGKELDKNKYLIARFQNQLDSIKEACSDMKFNKDGDVQRKIKTGNDVFYTYYTNYKGEFIVDGIDKKEFNY